MNYILIEKIEDFQTILESSILITGKSKLHEQEILENTWALALTPHMLALMSIEDLAQFVNAIIHRIQELVVEKNISATFYLWFDEMACHLRFNVISGCLQRLPFECKLEFVDRKEKIINAFLSSHYHSGIPHDEIQEIVEDVDDNDDDIKYVLKVFTLCIKPE